MKDQNTLAPVMVKDILDGVSTIEYQTHKYRNLINVNGSLYFVANHNENKIALWKSDGTKAGTVPILITDRIGQIQTFALLDHINDILFFNIYKKGFWKTDGTKAGTIKLKDFTLSGDHAPNYTTLLDGILYIPVYAGKDGVVLWKCDGTKDGTVPVLDSNSNSVKWPYDLVSCNGTIYFIARHPSPGKGRVLWKINETGQAVMVDTHPSRIVSPKNLTAVNSTLYFWLDARKPSPGRLVGAADSGFLELWKSDGTEAGTVKVSEVFHNYYKKHHQISFTQMNGILYFGGSQKEQEIELWKTDGTPEGTKMVKDINPAGSSDPRRFTCINDTLYFSADDGKHGIELWKTDGTPEGTKMVKDVNPTGSSLPEYLTNVNGTLFFDAKDGIHGFELWKLAPPPSTFAYIPNQGENNVTVINLQADKFGEAEVTIPVGNSPRTVAVSPNNAQVYIGNSEDQTVSVINTYTNTVKHTFPVSGRPLALAISPDNKKVVVTTSDLGSIDNPMIRIFDVETLQELQAFSVGYDPDGITIASDGTIYVPTHDNSNNGKVHVFKTNASDAYEQQTDLDIGALNRPDGIVLLEDKTEPKLYVAARGGSGGEVIVFSLTTNTRLKTVNMLRAPIGIVLSPDGSKVYFIVESDSDVRIIDTATDELTANTIPTYIDNPNGISISHDGAKLLVSNPDSNQVSHLDLTTNKWLAKTEVGKMPSSRGNSMASTIPVQEESISGVRAYIPIEEDLKLHNEYYNVLAVVDTEAEKVIAYTHATVQNINQELVGVAKSEVSPDSKQVMLSFKDSKTIAVVNTLTNRVEKTYELSGAVVDMEYSPDGYQLYVTTKSATKIEVVDFGNELVMQFDMKLAAEIRSLFFSPDGKKLYGIQDAPSGLVVGNPTANSSSFYPLAGEIIVDAVFHPSNNLAYLSTENGAIKTMDTTNGTVGPWEMTSLGEIAAIAIHPDGDTLYYINASDKRLYSIDIAGKTKTLITRVGMDSRCMQISGDGNTMYVLDAGTNKFLILDLTAPAPIKPSLINLEGKAVGSGRFVRG